MAKHSAASLLHRMTNRPLLASPDLARFYFGYLAQRDGLDNLMVDGTDLRDLAAVGAYRANDKGTLLVVPNTGIAVIEIEGSLTHKLGSIQPYSGMTGYDGIQAQIRSALADPDVAGILLDINSGGGEVAGAFDTANMIFNAATQKPVWAIADEAAYSAAYLLGSQAVRMTTTRTGGVGSVGVIAMHIDWSRYMQNQGADVTIIKAGTQKAEMSPFQPLSDAAAAKVQAEVDDAYQLFIDAVARGRDFALTASVVRETQAATMPADQALRLGFVDAIQSSADTYNEFAQHLATRGRTISAPASR